MVEPSSRMDCEFWLIHPKIKLGPSNAAKKVLKLASKKCCITLRGQLTKAIQLRDRQRKEKSQTPKELFEGISELSNEEDAYLFAGNDSSEINSYTYDRD